MTTKTTILLIAVAIVFFWIGQYWGFGEAYQKGYEDGAIKIVKSLDEKYEIACEDAGGIISLNREFGVFMCEIEKDISVLEEKKRCDNWDGKLYAKGSYGNGWSNNRIFGDKEMKIWCEKEYRAGNKEITETLFNYQF